MNNLILRGVKYYRYVNGKLEIYRPLEIINYDPKLEDNNIVKSINNSKFEYYCSCKELKDSTIHLIPNAMINIYIRDNIGLYITMNKLEGQLTEKSKEIEICIYQDEYAYESIFTSYENINDALNHFNMSNKFTIYTYIDDKDNDILDIIRLSNIGNEIDKALNNYQKYINSINPMQEPRYASLVDLLYKSCFMNRCKEKLGVKPIHSNLFDELENINPGEKIELTTEQILYAENYLMCYLSDIVAFKYSPFIDFDEIAKLDNNHILLSNYYGDIIYIAYNVERKFDIDADIAESMGVI